MEIIMKAIADLREHQRSIEARIGAIPVSHTDETSIQGNTLMPGRNRNQPEELLIQYMKFAPDEFSGTPPDPEKAEEWLQNAEHVVRHVSSDNSVWVDLVTYKLRGPSRDWWNAVMTTEEGKITWERFKDRKFSEFMFLTKGDMSVSAYSDKCTRLSRYGRALISTEEDNAKKFIRGLDPEMRKQFSCLRIKTYADALNRSLDYEKEMEDQSASRVRERPPQFLARQDPAKRPMTSAPSQTSHMPPIRPWQMGSTAGPAATRPPIARPQGQTIRPQGRWVRFQQVRPPGQVNSGSGSFDCTIAVSQVI
ncbi:hypothetical protein MKW94_020154 [Papaver nudicaule]|uniref:Retrotransposon gag domain-containing protein n=1 Tax=Papaver nudicaule TaxID=74823 RepID=A0AA41SKT0_PAPNU|nr:hypothetical protein [Papaver nudicaule]